VSTENVGSTCEKLKRTGYRSRSLAFLLILLILLTMNSSYDPTEIPHLYEVIASRDRYIVQVELELHRLRSILTRRDQQIHELTTTTTITVPPNTSVAIEDFFSAPSSSVSTEVATETIVETASKKAKRKISDYLVDGDVVKHKPSNTTFIYSGGTFVTEDGTLYNSLNEISTKLTTKKIRPNGWDVCQVMRGENTWITISKLEKLTI